MKKRSILITVVVIVLLSLVCGVYACKVVKTQDDIVDMLRKDLQLTKDNDTTISFISEFEIDENSLLWFSVQNQHMTNYRAVECHRVANGRYKVKKIYTPMTYAKDIVHVVWMAEDIFLINNPSCQSIIYRNESGDVISKTDISPDELPYIFLNKPLGSESMCDFFDAEGNVIR
jgi:hypothetical protein